MSNSIEKRKALQKVFLTHYDEHVSTLGDVLYSIQALSEIIDDHSVVDDFTLSGPARLGLAYILDLLAKAQTEAWGNLPSKEQIREMFEDTGAEADHE